MSCQTQRIACHDNRSQIERLGGNLGRGRPRGCMRPKQFGNRLTTDGAAVAAENPLRLAGYLENPRRSCFRNEHDPVRLNRTWDMDRLAIATAQIDV